MEFILRNGNKINTDLIQQRSVNTVFNPSCLTLERSSSQTYNPVLILKELCIIPRIYCILICFILFLETSFVTLNVINRLVFGSQYWRRSANKLSLYILFRKMYKKESSTVH